MRVGVSQDPEPADQCSLSSGNGFLQPSSITCHLLGSALAGRFTPSPCQAGREEMNELCAAAEPRAPSSGLSRVIHSCKKQCLAALCLEPAN